MNMRHIRKLKNGTVILMLSGMVLLTGCQTKNQTSKNIEVANSNDSVKLSTTDSNSSVKLSTTDNNSGTQIGSAELPELTLTQMQEDYDTLWKQIEEFYPYVPVASRVNKKDYSVIKNEYRKKLDQVKSNEEFYDLIDKCIEEFEHCGHLSIIHKGLNQCPFYVDYYNSYKENQSSNDTVSEWNFNSLDNPASKSFYQLDDTLNEVAKMKDQNTQNNSDETSSDDSAANGGFDYSNIFQTKYYDDDKIAYSKLNEMVWNDGDELDQAMTEFYSNLKDYPYCIIDIRGNSGGSNMCWENGILRQILKQEISVPVVELCNGDFNLTYEPDNDGQPKNEFDFSKFTKLNPQDLENADYVISYDATYPKGTHPYDGKVFLLVDQEVYSASDIMAYIFKQAGIGTLIGEATGGDGMGVDPAVFSLPNSGICYRFSVEEGLNPDGSSNEEFGITPDIECSSNDALDTCLKYIRSQK